MERTMRVYDFPTICRICLENNRDLVKIKDIAPSLNPDLLTKLGNELHFPESVCVTCCNRLTDTSLFFQQIENSRSFFQIVVKLEHNTPRKIIFLPKEAVITEAGSHQMLVFKVDDTEESCTRVSKPSSRKRLKDAIFNESEIAKNISEELELVDFEESKGCVSPSAAVKDHPTRCAEPYNSKSDLSKSAFICEICGCMFHRWINFETHISNHSQTELCVICYKYIPLGDYNKHMDLHKSCKSAECELCHTWFKDSGRLNIHLRTKHRTWECSVCGINFKKKNEFIEHNKKIHNEITINPPPACGKKSYTKVCELCGKVYNDTTSYNRHMIVHTGIKEFTCNECEKSFYTKNELKRHNIYLHEKELKKYACSLCNARFVTSDVLSSHVRMHYNFRAFVCEICGKGYFAYASLSKHLRQRHSSRSRPRSGDRLIK